MAEIKHRHRLEGLDGRIDPQESDWNASGEHTLVWRAESPGDLDTAMDAAAARLRDARGEATLEYLAGDGDAEEVVEKDAVEIVDVRLEEGELRAVLRMIGKRE